MASTFSRNYYDLLGVPRSATASEIQRRRRELALEFHPDKDGLAEVMKCLNVAAQTLCDPDERKKYDADLLLSDDASADISSLCLIVGPRPSETIVLSTLGQFLNDWQSGKLRCFECEKDIVDVFSKKWTTIVESRLPPFHIAQINTDDIVSDDDCGPEEAEPKPTTALQDYNHLIAAIQKNSLEEISNAFDCWTPIRWQQAMQMLSDKYEGIAVQNVCKPLFNIVLSLARLACSQYSTEALRSLASAGKWLWSALFRNSDEVRLDKNAAHVVARFVVSELAFGSGHASSLYASYDFADDKQTVELFPTVRLPNHLYWAMEVARPVDQTGRIASELRGMSTDVAPGESSFVLYRIERAIMRKQSCGVLSAKQGGDYYLDILPAYAKSSTHAAIINLTAAKLYMNHVLMDAKEPSEQYAFKELVINLLREACNLAVDWQDDSYVQLHCTGSSFAVLRMLLMKMPHIAQQEDIYVLEDFANKFIDLVRVFPLPFTPNVFAAEAQLLDIFGRRFCADYLLLLQSVQDESLWPMPKRFALHQLCMNDLSGVRKIEKPIIAKLSSMEGFLADRLGRKRSSRYENVRREVEAFIQSPMHCYSEPGWMVLPCKLYGIFAHSTGIHKIHGFRLNKQSGEAHYDLEFGQRPLVTSLDFETAAKSEEGCRAQFSLEQLLDERKVAMHPLQLAWFKPDELQESDFLHSLFVADYMMKHFSMGEEISYAAPFELRPLSEAPYWQELPYHLRQALRPVRERGSDVRSGYRGDRYWIQADRLCIRYIEDENVSIYPQPAFYDLFFTERQSVRAATLTQQHQTGVNKTAASIFGAWSNVQKDIYVLFEDVQMSVRTHPSRPDENGKFVDTDDDAQAFSPSKQFAADFTRVYDELSEHLPIFARLKELVKVQYITDMMRRHSHDSKTSESNSDHDANGIIGALFNGFTKTIKTVFSEIQFVDAKLASKGPFVPAVRTSYRLGQTPMRLVCGGVSLCPTIDKRDGNAGEMRERQWTPLPIISRQETIRNKLAHDRSVAGRPSCAPFNATTRQRKAKAPVQNSGTSGKSNGPAAPGGGDGNGGNRSGDEDKPVRPEKETGTKTESSRDVEKEAWREVMKNRRQPQFSYLSTAKSGVYMIRTEQCSGLVSKRAGGITETKIDNGPSHLLPTINSLQQLLDESNCVADTSGRSTKSINFFRNQAFANASSAKLQVMRDVCAIAGIPVENMPEFREKGQFQTQDGVYRITVYTSTSGGVPTLALSPIRPIRDPKTTIVKIRKIRYQHYLTMDASKPLEESSLD